MTATRFLVEWAIRSSVLIVAGMLLVRAFRVKDPSIRLAALIAMLGGSVAIPALTTVAPKISLTVMHTAPRPLEATLAVKETPPSLAQRVPQQNAAAAKRFNWARAGAGIYMLVACALLLRLCAGLVMSLRLLRNSRATGHASEGIQIRESDRVTAPVTLGIMRSLILLPSDWREWDRAKLDAVVAHESSHIRRKDPALQLLSAIHRALLWHSPLSWFLHKRIVRVAEEASDDAALAVTRDREAYAEVLLDFMRRGVRGANLQGVAMARYGQPAERITRILDGASLSRGVTRWSLLAILACGSPLAYLVAAAQTQLAATAAAQPSLPASSTEPAASAGAQAPAAKAPAGTAAPVRATTPQPKRSIRRYMIVSGDSINGSWDSSDRADEEELRERFGQNFAWFWEGRSEYVVTDAGVLAELEEAMAPQREVNRMQSDVNKQQDVVNQHQATVNRAQDGVNAIQGAVNRRQQLINELQAAKGDDELIRRLEATLAELRANKGETKDQEAANREQAKVNEMQTRVNEEQGEVNGHQHKVNEEQRRVSAQLEGRIEVILDSAVGRHLAQQLR